MVGAVVKNMYEEVLSTSTLGLCQNTYRWSALCATAILPTASSHADTASVLAVSRSGITSVPTPLALCAVSPLTSRDFTG